VWIDDLDSLGIDPHGHKATTNLVRRSHQDRAKEFLFETLSHGGVHPRLGPFWKYERSGSRRHPKPQSPEEVILEVIAVIRAAHSPSFR
jgi:hypothetical protein